MKSTLHAEWMAEGADYPPTYEQLLGLLRDALDLVPRISGFDPMSPALTDWCRVVRLKVKDAEAALAADREAVRHD